MYLSHDYFLTKAAEVIKAMGVSYKKETSGTSKGYYGVKLIFPKDVDWASQSGYLKAKFGSSFQTWLRHARPEKEDALESFKNQIAGELNTNHNRQNQQLVSDIKKYYDENKEKEKNNIHFDGRIGRNLLDYFGILENRITPENYTNVHQLKGKNTTQIGQIKNFKEFYYFVKNNAKEEWLNRNRALNDEKKPFERGFIDYKNFQFDEENIPEIATIENELEGIKAKELPVIPIVQSSLENKGFIKVGFRPEFLNGPIIYGRERSVILASGEKHKALFAIVELDDILASHNENNFSSTEGYPLTPEGRNINDRNYASDVNAQSKVISVSQNFQPEIIISTSATASGTPIISTDGIVISGNNRTMSLKLAKNQNKEQWENYLTSLSRELQYEGFGFDYPGIGIALKLKDSISLPGSSYNNPLSVQFSFPILVRIDYDFQSYTTEEMSKYNKSTKKSERPIDSTIKMAQQLSENSKCLEILVALISEQEIISDLYNNPAAVKRLKAILIDCNLITENDVAALFTGVTLTENGKSFYNSLLLSLILNPDVLEISQNPGIKSIVNNVVNAIVNLNKNKLLEQGSLITEVNNAILLQNKMISAGISNIAEYIKEGELFEENFALTRKSAIINYWLNQKQNDFKNKLRSYNNSMQEMLLPTFFEEKLTEEEIFYQIFEKQISDELKNSLNLVFPPTPVKFEVVSVSGEEIPNVLNDKKADLEKELMTLRTAYKYTKDAQTADLIATLEITLKYQ